MHANRRELMKTVCAATIITIFSSAAFAQAPQMPKPGAEHEYLQKSVGTHTGIMKVWPAGPKSDPIEMPFKETNKAIHNGFWVESLFESGPYKGRGMSGFDPIKKKYIGTWTSNMTPFMSVMEGTYDENKHEFTMLFKDYDHATNEVVDMKSVTVDAPEKPHTMTMYKKNKETGEWETSFILTYNKKDN